MNPNEDYYARQARLKAEAKQRQAIDDAEYEANQAQQKAARAAREAREAKQAAAAERSNYESELEDLRDELGHVENDKAKLIATLGVATDTGAALIYVVRQLLVTISDPAMRLSLTASMKDAEDKLTAMREEWGC